MTDSVTTTATDTASSRRATSLRATRRARMRRGYAALSVRMAGAPGFNHTLGAGALYEDIL